ncbi:MAG: MBOAT family protein [Bacilli bacterium]|nr:MBOAT family protein [Bacilli bacterium]
MLFNSFKFLIFFPIVTCIYFLIKKDNIKLIWLLICSYFFYMCWNPIFALLMLFSTFVTYIFSLLMEKYKKHKKLFLILSLIINLLILFCFKYLTFIIENINNIFKFFNISGIKTFDILLPVGISFYTFQALSYSFDVYRNDVKVEKNFIKYALFVSFFPQLVAGPIEKSKIFLSQFNLKHKFDYNKVKNGILIMLGGFILKLVIADRAAIAVNQVYNNLSLYTGLSLILATVLFAFQIYCDFYAYSLIAKGSAQVLGYNLSQNFNKPYLSTSIKDFWRRWHISLSTWFKEYLYVPLGGSKVSKLKTIRNILIVFCVSGLWHGAAWTFLIWGLLHGLYQVIGMLIKNIRNKISNILLLEKHPLIHKIFQIIICFILVDFAWIFFRANTLYDAFYVIKNIFDFSEGLKLANFGLSRANLVLLFFSIVCLMIYEIFNHKFDIIKFINKRNIIVRWILYFIIIYIILIFGIYGPGYDASQFIYFQF